MQPPRLAPTRMGDARGLDGGPPAAAPESVTEAGAQAPSDAAPPPPRPDAPPREPAPEVPAAPWTVPPPAAPKAAPAPAAMAPAPAPAPGGVSWDRLAFLTALLPAGVAIGWWLQGGKSGKA